MKWNELRMNKYDQQHYYQELLPWTKEREKFITLVYVVVLEGITKIWLDTLSLDLDCSRRANNVWYCSGVKPIC